MKTIFFAILNVLSFFVAILILEFFEGPIWLMLGSMIAFVLSGFFSIFKKGIWDQAHKDQSQTASFLLKSQQTFASIITTFIVLMSIVADFVQVDQNYVQFICYVTVYLALFIPCHLVILQPQSHQKGLG